VAGRRAPYRNNVEQNNKITNSELRRCNSFKECISKALDLACRVETNSKESRRERFARLVATLQNMNAGKTGGGLSGALATEIIWKELLKDINLEKEQFTFDHRHADADFSHCAKSFSLKTLGSRNKNADLALAWSKNKAGAKKRYFQSAMVILSFRPASLKAKTKFWRTAKQGVYIIPLATLRSTVKRFKRNNKTNTLIKAKYVVKLMEYAVSKELFLPLEIYPEKWADYELSYWKGGNACLMPKRLEAKWV